MGLDHILKSGESIYLNNFRKDLENKYLGSYVVIDTDKKDFVVADTKLKAFDLAKDKFGDKLFYIVQVGELRTPTANFKPKATLSWAS